MKRIILAAALTFTALVSAACQKADLKNLLQDFRWGLAEACSQEWVPQNECTLGDAGFVLALSIVDKSPANQIKHDVISVLENVEAQVPADSRLKPYIDDVLIVLK